jgi:hypothetical protein
MPCHEPNSIIPTSTATCCSLLLAVVEEGSVTRAAQRLGVTQSAVSHLLDKLRAIVGDPLFVKSGRGIVPPRGPRRWPSAPGAAGGTARLRDAEASTRRAAGRLHHRRQRPAARPAAAAAAAPAARAGAGLTLRVIPSGVPAPRCCARSNASWSSRRARPTRRPGAKAPVRPTATVVFFDAAAARRTGDLADYLAPTTSPCSTNRGACWTSTTVLAERGVQRRFVASVPGFAGMAAFLRGAAAGHAAGVAAGRPAARLRLAEPPLAIDPMPMFMVWHARRHSDPVHSAGCASCWVPGMGMMCSPLCSSQASASCAGRAAGLGRDGGGRRPAAPGWPRRPRARSAAWRGGCPWRRSVPHRAACRTESRAPPG